MINPYPRPIIEVDRVTKQFGADVVAVDAVRLDIVEGEFFALLGPSGCGKTTLLRMIAGFETPSAGTIRIDGVDMARTPPNKRPVNMVFQSYAVFPHMSVAQNVAYGLKMENTAKAECEDRVADALSLVQLDGFGQRRPDQLSGGQRQRVALARALVKRPKVLLLDEPLSALDAKLREAMQLELVRLQKSVGITFVVVTHDQDEALSMADRIAVMDAGQVQQTASPPELYERPNSRFVADFIGKMNVISANALGGVISAPEFGTVAKEEGLSDGPVSVAIRPEKLWIGRPSPEGDHVTVEATVTARSYHGAETQIYAKTDGGTVLNVMVQNDRRDLSNTVTVGETLSLSWRCTDTLVLRD